MDVGEPSTEMRVGTMAGFSFSQGNDDGVQNARFSGPVALAQLARGSTYMNTEGVVEDVSGWVAVVDHNNSTVRLIDHASGSVSTLAGGNPGFRDGDARVARMRRPHDIAVCADGSFVIADMGNHAIRSGLAFRCDGTDLFCTGF